jgi:HSP20 family protein
MPTPTRKDRKDEDPFADLFADFEREFRRMQGHLNELFEEALKQPGHLGNVGQPGNPFVYGFSVRLGPDGKPHFEQFGNVPHPLRPEAVVEGGREPLTDVIDHDDSITVTAELPGVEKEDVQVYATERQLTVKVDTAQRKYYKEVALPAAVRPESTEATFKNGVLDVTVRKQQRTPAPTGHRVNVK